MNYVLLEISYLGIYASAKENFILSREVFDKHKEQILDVLGKSWYPELNGKHNHVDGEYSFSYLDDKSALDFFKSRNYVGLGRTLDCLQEDLDTEAYQELNSNMNEIAKNLFAQIKELDLKIDLTGYEDVDYEKEKILQLLAEHGYKLV